MDAANDGNISYEPMGKFKFGVLLGDYFTYETKKVEEVLQRVEKRIGKAKEDIVEIQ
ncbi:MAG: hypothetical protein RBT73_06225 [Spirochaetia bacterium]|jgi:hypothetical protein|nr:hypothetical protein [Spirochaetia bacterium]